MKHLDSHKVHLNFKKHYGDKYRGITVLGLVLIVFGFFQNTPDEILSGMKSILLSNDILISDYFVLGNIGSAFINSGLLILAFTFILYLMKLRLTGSHIAGIFIIGGFALFGKSLLNVWFPFIGVWLYSKYNDEPFSYYVVVALYSTTLAPIVSEIIFYPSLEYIISIPLGIFAGIFLGFLIVPIASSLVNAHQGLCIFNTGFAAGLMGTVFISLFKSYGFNPYPKMLWSSGNNFKLSILLFSLFGSILIYGFILNGKTFKGYKRIINLSGRLITDFIVLVGKGPTLINMGIMGILSTAYILIIQGDLNGPTIGAIFTVCGFSAFGMHPKNVIPVWIGIFIAAYTKVFNINTPSIQLAALFGAGLGPITGEFGIFWGMLAGILHSSVVQYTGYLYNGLSLYNNGFSTGIVATVLAPVIEAFKKERI